MSNIKFDPELIQNIRIIYGDADLDNKTLQQLYNTWQTNPEIIRNTAQQKLNVTKQVIQESQNTTPKVVKTQSTEVINDTAQDDLSNISSFGTAFKEARKRGLKAFKWKKTKQNPSGLYTTNLKDNSKKQSKPENKLSNQSRNQSGNQSIVKEETNQMPELVYFDVVAPKVSLTTSSSLSKMNAGVKGSTFSDNEILKRNKKYTEKKKTAWNPYGDIFVREFPETKPQGLDYPTMENLQEQLTFGNYQQYRKKYPKNDVSWNPYYGDGSLKYQQGGTMNNQEEMQKAFMAYLIEEATAQGMESEEQIRAYIEQLGQEGLKAKYQEFIKKMQVGRKAKLGTKLEYYNYLKKGGKTCCEQKGGNIPTTPVKKQNEVQKFKSNRKRLDPEKTPILPGGKYPSYWTPDERIKWERKYGDKQEGTAAVEPLGKNR